MRGNLIKGYLLKYPNIASRTLSKIVYHDYPDIFTNAESVRDLLRYYRGRKGKLARKSVMKKYGKYF